MGGNAILRIYRYADVFHCEPIAKTADGFITNLNIPKGILTMCLPLHGPRPLDNRAGLRAVIEDISGDDEEHIIDRLVEVYTSWINTAISNYNTDFYYQPRDYIRVCYEEGQICA